jgi:hypothetical protein
VHQVFAIDEVELHSDLHENGRLFRDDRK